MAVTPDSEIRLIKCNLNLDSENQINFATKTAQYNYFNSLTHLTITGASYQRKDNYIRYPEHVDNLIDYNYVMYKNTHYKDKWFYAYITRMEYENDNCTRVYIKTDVFQTWQFDLTYMKSFVEREHVNSDNIGEHTIDEGLGTGEYINNNFGTFNIKGTTRYFIVGVSNVLPNMHYSTSRTYGGLVSGLQLYTFQTYDNKSPAEHFTNFVRAYDNKGKGADIYEIFVAPDYLLYANSITWHDYNEDGISFHYGLVSPEVASSSLTTITINTTLNGYKPKNKKMFVAPYNYLYVSNNCGADAVYHYEDFVNNSPQFLRDGILSPGCNIRVYPINYKKISDNAYVTEPKKSFQYGINAPKFPICSWNSDSYTNWITQNGVNLATSVVSHAALAAGSAATGNVAGAISGVSGIINNIAEINKASMIPNTVGGNVNSSDVAYISANIEVTYSQMSVRAEMAKVIDDFFSMYGYKVNTLKTPNITGRSNWNYVKMINPNIEGYIPQEDLQEIKSLFTNGITIWHTTTHFLDYSQTNSII